MSLIRKLAGETLIYGLGSVLPRILNFLLLAPYFTRILKESSYGIHGIMYSFSALLLILYTYRMETAFFRFGNKEKDFKTSFSTASIGVFIVSCLFTAIILMSSQSIASVLTSGSDYPYVIYFAFIIFFDAVSALPFAKLRLQNRAVRFAALKILNVGVNILVVLFLIEMIPYLHSQEINLLAEWYQVDKKLDYIFIANLCASAFVFVIIAIEYRDVELKINQKVFSKMFKYSLPLIVVGIAGVINQLIDRYLVKELLPGDLISNLGQSGIYNACVKIAVLMLLFTTAFNYAAEPFFFKNYDRKDAQNIYAKVALAFTIAGCMIFLTITLYIDVFQYLIGENFRSGLKIVPILLIAYMFLGLYYNFSIWYKLTDRTHFGAIIASIGAVITLALNFILVPKIGYFGSSIAALACFFSMTVLAVYFGKKYYPIPYSFGKIGTAILLAVGIYLVNTYLRSLGLSLFILLSLNSLLILLFILLISIQNKALLKELVLNKF